MLPLLVPDSSSSLFASNGGPRLHGIFGRSSCMQIRSCRHGLIFGVFSPNKTLPLLFRFPAYSLIIKPLAYPAQRSICSFSKSSLPFGSSPSHTQSLRPLWVVAVAVTLEELLMAMVLGQAVMVELLQRPSRQGYHYHHILQ